MEIRKMKTLTADERLIIEAAAAIDPKFARKFRSATSSVAAGTPVNFSITISPAGAGTVSIVPDDPSNSPNGPYYMNEIMTLTPHAASGYHFDHFEDQNGFGYVENPWMVGLDGDLILTAYFTGGAPPTYTVPVTISPTGAGVVAVSPAGPYTAGNEVSLVATANPGYVFDHWYYDGISDPANNSNTLQFNIYGNTPVTAVFVTSLPGSKTYTMSVSASPSSEGTATISPAGPYQVGTDVKLVATPKTGYQFDHWEINGLTYITSTVYVSTPAQNSTAVAYFVASTTTNYSLLVAAYPAGGGGFTQSPSGNSFAPGSSVTLNAIANSGYKFAYWLIGNQQITDAAIVITMNSDMIVQATFFSNSSGGTDVQSLVITNPGSTVKVGGNLTFNLTDWEDDDSVTISIISGNDAVWSGVFKTNDEGSIGGAITVEIAAGKYTLKAIDSGGATASAPFTITSNGGLVTAAKIALIAGGAAVVVGVIVLTGNNNPSNKKSGGK
jgi:hypothetical protein